MKLMKVGMVVVSMTLTVVGFKAEAAESAAKKMNILCVCAHPDDAEFLCGGTLLKYRKQGHNIFIALTTSGNTGSNVMTDTKEIERVREAEMLASAKILGAQVRFLRNDDERLLDTNETRTQVLDAMRWADPDVIFTHAPNDESPDHKMTSHLVRAMVLSLPGKNQQASEKPCTKKVSVFTCLPGAGIDFQPEAYVNITDEIDDKLRALACHKSQLPYMADFGKDEFIDGIRIVSAFYGVQSGCKYAEGFKAFRISGYMPDFKVLP